MDDTQSSKVSDTGATRKRRSSILKSQRAARAPLSELEFNVATPTDTAKSRRVSFSRRTGVAEFVTNEATTAWKNIYEEHNKTLESSGNDTDVHAPRPSVSHLSKGLFCDQFQEIKAINFDTTYVQDSSVTDVNFNQSALECTSDDCKLSAAHQNFEFSTFTDHQSKLFSDDLAISGPEVTDKININFSTMEPVGDDLDEIQKDYNLDDFARPGRSSCMSEYIEIDLNVTHGPLQGDECDMSITDTIHSPKVNVSKSNASGENDKLISKDWVADKENIMMNPYVTPKETDNFAINEQPDQVLVFDGKRLTIQSEKEPILDYHEAILPAEKKSPIVLNSVEDLTVFEENQHALLSLARQSLSNRTLVGDNGDLSLTQALPGRIEASDTRNTLVYEDGNISIKQNVLSENVEKRRTIIFEDNTADISVTQAVPSNLIFSEKDLPKDTSEKRKTIVFEDAEGNISITQALPSKVILTEKGEVIPVKRKTILYETDVGNISVTQVGPSALSLSGNRTPEKSKTLIFNEDIGHISITQGVPLNMILQEQTSSKRKTIIFDEEGGNISITQTIPKNLILSEKSNMTEEFESGKTNETNAGHQYDNDGADMSVTQALLATILADKRKSFAPDHTANVSITQAVPSNLILPRKEGENCKTIVYDDNNIDISMTEGIPNPIVDENISQSNNKTSAFNLAEMSLTKAIPNNTILHDNLRVNDTNANDMSVTEAILPNILAEEKHLSEAQTTEALPKDIEESSVCSSDTTITELQKVDSNEADISMTASEDIDNKLIGAITKENVPYDIVQNEAVHKNESMLQRRTSTKPIPGDLLTLQKDLLNKSNINRTTDVLVYQTSTHSAKPIKTEYPVSNTSSSAACGNTDDLGSTSAETVSYVLSHLVATAGSSAKDTEERPSKEVSESNSKAKEGSSLNVANELGYTSSAVSKLPNKEQKSILDDLLDMHDDEPEGTEDKSIMVKISDHSSSNMKLIKSESEGSKDSLFYIRDSTDEKSEDERSQQSDVPKNPANHSLKTLSAPKEKPGSVQPDIQPASSDSASLKKEFESCIEDLEKKLLQLQQSSPNRSPTRNRHFEKVISSDLESLNNDYRRKSVKDANNTEDLLDMLSRFTDKEEEEDPLKPIEVEKTQRPSAVSRRLSEVLSREDLMNDISMAQAVLKQTCGTDAENESVAASDKTASSKKGHRAQNPGRFSHEVIKTLRFEDDESTSETSVKLDALSPLKKTAFGETSYMTEERKRNENKSKVIPSFEVSDGLKELMDDLVKPNADVLPYETTSVGREVRKSTSSCSTQIQANIVTSSQVDLDPEGIDWSSPSALLTSGMRKLKGIMKTSNIASTSEPGTASERSLEVVSSFHDEIKPETFKKYFNESEDNLYDATSQDEERQAIDQSVPGQVIVFDPHNPLNNVLLAPIDLEDAHRYQPPSRKESTLIADSDQQMSMTQVTFKDDNDRSSTNYSVPEIIPDFMLHSTNSCIKKVSPKTIQSADSRRSTADSRRTSVDHSVGTPCKLVKDEEINTVIVMKDNKKLLEMSSSLTLVDDTISSIERGPYFGELDSGTSKDVSPSSSMARVQVIYAQTNNPEKEDSLNSDKVDSDVNTDYLNQTAGNKKKRKHTNDKHKICTLSSMDLTPKPAAKMTKQSLSPQRQDIGTMSPMRSLSRRLSPKRLSTKQLTSKQYSPKQISPKESPTMTKKAAKPKRKSSPKIQRPNTNITVQQLLTEFTIARIHHSGIERNVNHSLLEAVSSFSSTRSNELGDAQSASGLGKGPMDWQPELINELSSKNLVAQCDSGVDVVAKIDMLPFMGSRECSWECMEEGSWTFLLLLGRLRLRVALAGERRGRARADTRLAAVSIEATSQPQYNDKKNAIAVVCVRFALEAMRYLIGRGACARAGELPALLRRCAGVARVALLWGRAMHDAWAHLAYALTHDGFLTLKVANIPLRSVWEVTMSIELVVSDAREVPWPRATDVRVTPVVTDVRVTPDEVRRALARVPHDWGHAPRTLWKIFKYLKNKSRDDDLFLAL